MILGAIALFFYVGVEVIAGDTIIRYGQSLQIDMSSAKYYTSLTMLGMIIGYMSGIIFIPRMLSTGKCPAHIRRPWNYLHLRRCSHPCRAADHHALQIV